MAEQQFDACAHIALAGDWSLVGGASRVKVVVSRTDRETVVELPCRHGLGIQVELRRN